ncbi:hypothetical protein Golob_024180 [Gossypium lobatum]|uniref:Zinc knuckle CX2CX4HX4C domain-containing protein n=1 Tax=Gossypium lobatum TaxID=34289 RepID=A0A7J8NEY6_9ROSI|nr:hypothetical protein [Gossypium lobatum]
MELKFTEFWIQVHDLPPGSMNESMAKQFGNFCGKFLEYDSSIPTLGTQNFLRTRVRLDVTVPLKHKKKVLFGKSLVVYARFKYEKLSLFCFICGRLGYGESFCPLRLQINPSKIIFGWDLSLRAVVKCRNMTESRWLRTANGSPCILDKLGNSNQGSLIYEEKVLGQNVRGANGSQNVNPNLIQLGIGQYGGNSRDYIGYNGGNDKMGRMGLCMDLWTWFRMKRMTLLHCWKLRSFSLFHIDVEIHDNEGSDTWRLIGFYGHPDERNRSTSWDLLRQLSHNQTIPWVVVGDFNEIANSFKKKGRRLRSERQMKEFCEALEDCNLTDLGFTGRWFTWERGRFVSINIKEQLDRGVATLSWVNRFPGYRIEHLSHSFFDHCPLLLDSEGVKRN